MTLEFVDTYKTITVTDAIATVEGVTLLGDHVTMSYAVSYKGPSATDNDIYNTEYFSCSYDPTAGDIVAQAYANLLTQTKFASATQA